MLQNLYKNIAKLTTLLLFYTGMWHFTSFRIYIQNHFKITPPLFLNVIIFDPHVRFNLKLRSTLVAKITDLAQSQSIVSR